MYFSIRSKKMFFLFLFSFMHLHCTDQDIILKNIYHHRGGNNGELARVAFYFSAKPVIKRVSSESVRGNVIKNIYSLQGVRIQKEKMSAFPIINERYRLDAQLVDNGLQFTVMYDPRSVATLFDTFDSISLQKGLVIHFLDCAIVQQKIMKSPKKKNNEQKIIVIDCGHGGGDAGAIGCFGIKEKDIVLAVGLRVAQLLKKAGMHVLLTRSSDIDLALDARTSYANCHNADLFISIHANYAKNASAQGIDTFCMQVSLLHSDNDLGDVRCYDALHDLMKMRAHESGKLARAVHESVITCVKNKYPTVVDRHIKYEVAQILLGSHMPAVLIEVGFVSHEQEAKRLRDCNYQQLLASSISRGIIAYLKE